MNYRTIDNSVVNKNVLLLSTSESVTAFNIYSGGNKCTIQQKSPIKIKIIVDLLNYDGSLKVIFFAGILRGPGPGMPEVLKDS